MREEKIIATIDDSRIYVESQTEHENCMNWLKSIGASYTEWNAMLINVNKGFERTLGYKCLYWHDDIGLPLKHKPYKELLRRKQELEEQLLSIDRGIEEVELKRRDRCPTTQY